MTERNDAATAYGEAQAAIAEDIAAAAVSRLRADALGRPDKWPLQVSWCATSVGLLIETEHGRHTIAPDAPIRPAEILRRLIHPGFAASRWADEAHWC
jgi:hypothetical protein